MRSSSFFSLLVLHLPSSSFGAIRRRGGIVSVDRAVFHPLILHLVIPPTKTFDLFKEEEKARDWSSRYHLDPISAYRVSPYGILLVFFFFFVFSVYSKIIIVGRNGYDERRGETKRIFFLSWTDPTAIRWIFSSSPSFVLFM